MPANGSKKPRRFITVKEAAGELGLGPWTIWKWIRENKTNSFPMKRIGHRVFILRSKFEEWCETTDNH